MVGTQVDQSAMKPLCDLHSRLASLRRRRWWLRATVGLCTLVLVLAGVLTGAFVVDWLTGVGRLPRAGMLLAGLAAIAAAFLRWAHPALTLREDDIQLALFVQRQHQIDTDLVAALQFDSPRAESWGSPRLQQEVIEHAGRVGGRLDAAKGISYGQAITRAAAAIFAALALAAFAVSFPGHAAVFFNRLLLGDSRYPTLTRLDRVSVNQWTVRFENGKAGESSEVASVAEGQPVVFRVEASGELPDAGDVVLRDQRTGRRTTVRLEAADAPKPRQASSRQSGRAVSRRTYVARLKQLVSSVDYEVFLGDAWTEPAPLRLIPRPRVDVQVQVTPPDYAALAGQQKAGQREVSVATGARQTSVLEGSRVEIRLVSTKPLASAELTIGQAAYAMARDAASSTPDRLWRIADAAPPLAVIVGPLEYAIQVTDTDGLRLEEPLMGAIRLRPDRRPKVFADITTRHVLPTARPSIWYGVSDDFGLAELKVHVTVQSAQGGKPTKHTLPIPLAGHPQKISPLVGVLAETSSDSLDARRIPAALRRQLASRGIELSTLAEVAIGQPGERWFITDPNHPREFLLRREDGRVNVYRQFHLPLEKFGLHVKDQVRVELEAVDFRGPTPGKSSVSKTILLQVTDQQGVFAAMLETDQRSAQQLNAIIQRQLGIGESP